MKEKIHWKSVRKLLLVIGGNACYAFFVQLFILPGGLMTGGTTGIGLVLGHFFRVPLSTFVLIFNIVMLLLGWVILGKQFALTTIVSSFTYPLFLELWGRLFTDVVLTENAMLNTIFAGIGIGIGLGIVIRNGASTGGMDIPPLVLNKFFHIPVSVSLYVFDTLILLGQAVYSPMEQALYGILLVMIYSFVLDRMMIMGSTRTEVKVISTKPDKIREAILSGMDRGVTVLKAEGGYLRKETEVLLSVISNRELPQVEKFVHEIDPESFLIISRVSEVRGRGFSMSKKYR